MNPSFLHIKLPKEKAVSRFIQWIDGKILDGPRKVSYYKAVKEACDNDTWRGLSVLIYEYEDETFIEDMTGALASVSAAKWLEYAENDEFEFVGYNDSVPYGQIIAIQNGSVIKDFLQDEQEPSENRNTGTIDFEKTNELNEWHDAAEYVDSILDSIEIPDECDLLIFSK